MLNVRTPDIPAPKPKRSAFEWHSPSDIPEFTESRGYSSPDLFLEIERPGESKRYRTGYALENKDGGADYYSHDGRRYLPDGTLLWWAYVRDVLEVLDNV